MEDGSTSEGAEDAVVHPAGEEVPGDAAAQGDGTTEAGPGFEGERVAPVEPLETAAPAYASGDLWAEDLLSDDIRAAGSSALAAELLQDLSRHLLVRDKAAFVRTAVEAVTAERLTIPELYRDVLAPLIVDIGAGWQEGQVAVWEEHMATAMVRTVVEILYPGVLKAKLTVSQTGRRVLLAAPPEEAHDLGLRMVSDRFDMAGWTTYFLGADMPIDEIVDAARKLHVDAVVLSSATHYHRVALRACVDRIERELPHVRVWVGGSAFVYGGEDWAGHGVRDLEALLAESAPPRDTQD
ncbi:MAG TPA: cobalamin-dependent protein [Thermoleophilia bacterium]|nr:cobalamin-dependent protein [Thermoleophilia bacterium]